MYILVAIICCVTIIQFSYCFDLSALQKNTEAVEIVKEVISKYQREELQAENEECTKQIKLFVENLENATDDGTWGLQMIDATGKIPSGILELNLIWPGRFEECLNIASLKTNVKGKYCLTTMESSKDNSIGLERQHTRYKQLRSGDDSQVLPSLYVGICIPDKCTNVDIQNVLNSSIAGTSWVATCQTKETVNAPLDTGAIITICYIGIFVVVMAASTTYDVLTREGNPHPLLISFSVYSNGIKLFGTSKNPGAFSCLYGIKCLSMMWVIVGHVFSTRSTALLSNILDALSYFSTTKSMVFVNGVHAVDTFFVMTGMLVVYNFMKAKHQGHKFNIFIFYLHRYMRLTPAIVPLMLATMYWVKYLGSGPFHPTLENALSEPCKTNWWTTLLYVQNYVNDAICIGQSWYLNVDWQLYLVSPIFLLFLPKLPLVGLGLMLCATVGSIAAAYIITWRNSLIAVLNNTYGNYNDYLMLYYIVTHTRASTWFIGGFLGYILAKIKLERNVIYLKFPKWLIGLIWIIVLAAILACVFAGREALTSEVYHPYSNAFYNAFTRPAWGMCIAWIIFACSVGYGGIINKFLSLPVFQVLSRFTFSMYLLHFQLLNIIELSRKDSVYFTLFDIFYSFWGIWALSFGLSIFWVLAFESPLVALEKYFLGSRKTPSRNTEINVSSPQSTENTMIYKENEQP